MGKDQNTRWFPRPPSFPVLAFSRRARSTRSPVGRSPAHPLTRSPAHPLTPATRLVQGQPRLMPFPEIEEPLRELLEQYGPPRDSHHPEYPFWRLQTDGLWEVLGAKNLTRRKSNSDALKTELRSHEIEGGLLPEVHELLRQDAALPLPRTPVPRTHRPLSAPPPAPSTLRLLDC